MSKKYYEVEFTIFMGAWGEDEDEAYEIARRRVLDAKDNLNDLLTNYDECVTESKGDCDYDDPDAPALCDQCGEPCHNQEICPELEDHSSPNPDGEGPYVEEI